MWDFFFFSGLLPLLDEIQDEIRVLLLQPRGRLYFNRSEGSLVPSRENSPGSIAQEIQIRFDITDAIARRNLVTDDGELTGRPKQIAMSQNTITLNRPDQNSLSVNVSYFVLNDLSAFREIEVVI